MLEFTVSLADAGCGCGGFVRTRTHVRGRVDRDCKDVEASPDTLYPVVIHVPLQQGLLEEAWF